MHNATNNSKSNNTVTGANNMLKTLISRQHVSVDFSAQGRSWTNHFFSTQSLGAQKNPILEKYYDRWSQMHVHYGARENGTDLSVQFLQESNSSMMVPTDDATALVDVWKDGKHVPFDEFLKRFKFIGTPTPKHMKRMKRLFRLFLQGQYAFLNPQEIRIRYIDVDPDVWDGIVIFSHSFIKKIVKNADYSGMSRQEIKARKRDMLTATIGYPTIAFGEAYAEGERLPKGTIKGMAHVAKEDVFMLRDKDGAIVETYTDFDILMPKKTVKEEFYVNDDSLFFVDFRPTHAKEDKLIDFGTLSSKWKFFGVDNLKKWLKDDAISFMQSVYDEEARMHPSSIKSAKSFQQSEAWVLGQYLLSGGNPMASTKMLEKVFGQYGTEMDARMKKNRIPSKAKWAYLAPYSVYMGLNPLAQPIGTDEAHLNMEQACIYIEDETLLLVYKSLGGGDGDDPVIITPYKYQGVTKMMINRNPNAENEYYLLHPIDTAFESVPTLDESVLQTQFLECEPKTQRLSRKKSECWLDFGFTQKEAVLMAKTMIQNLGVLGRVCNTTYLEGVLGLTSTLPFPMEDVVDGTTQEGVDMTPALQWATDRVNEIILEGHELPKTILPKIINSVDAENIRLIQLAEDHWLDDLMDTHQSIKDHLLGYNKDGEFIPGQAHELARRIKPAAELMQAGRPFQAIGKVYNQMYWENYMFQLDMVDGLKDSLMGTDEELELIGGLLSVQWDDLKTWCEEYVSNHESPLELLLGTYYHIHSRGKEVPSETPLWLGNVGPMMIHAMRHAGYLNDIKWDEHAGVISTKREVVPTNLESIAIRNVGSNMLQRRGITQDKLDAIRFNLERLDWTDEIMHVEVHGDNVVITYNETVIGWMGKHGTTTVEPGQTFKVKSVQFTDSRLRLMNQEYTDVTVVALVEFA